VKCGHALFPLDDSEWNIYACFNRVHLSFRNMLIIIIRCYIRLTNGRTSIGNMDRGKSTNGEPMPQGSQGVQSSDFVTQVHFNFKRGTL
jgi:hypothetical protein